MNCCPVELQQCKFVRFTWPVSVSVIQYYHNFKYLLKVFLPHYNLVELKFTCSILLQSSEGRITQNKPTDFYLFRICNLNKMTMKLNNVSSDSIQTDETSFLGSYILLHKLWNYPGLCSFLNPFFTQIDSQCLH